MFGLGTGECLGPYFAADGHTVGVAVNLTRARADEGRSPSSRGLDDLIRETRPTDAARDDEPRDATLNELS